MQSNISGMKIVVDCAEGAAYYTSVEALRELGATVVPIHNMPDGTNINANCGSTHMEELQARVVYEKADVGLAFDGDADRLLAVDENGEMVDGDQIMGIVGVHMRDQGKLILCAGQGAFENDALASTQELTHILRNLGVNVWKDIWGTDVVHDWPWWCKQLPYFLRNLLDTGN